MDEFCNGDGMPDFMSVLLPLCKLLGSEFNWIKQKKRGEGAYGTFEKKINILKSLFGFICREMFQSACL